MKADDPWLIAAERFDSWRVVPRLMLFGYAGLVQETIMYTLSWYTHLKIGDKSAFDSLVVGAVITAVTGFAPWIFKIYVDSGRSWDSLPVSTTETMTSSKTVTP